MNDFCEGCNQRFAPIDQQACWGCKDGDLNSSKREITSNNAQIFATGSKDGRKLPENVPETNVGKINGRTPDEIKKGLKICYMGTGCEECPYDTAPAPVCYDDMKRDALAYIQQLEERNSKLEYTLLGVMHSVDKWLNVEPYDFDKDDGTVAATRASNAREVALKAIEKAHADLAQAERERDAAVADLKSVDEKYEDLKSMIDNVIFNHEPYSLYLDFREAADAMIEHEHADVWNRACPENTKEDGTNAC